MLFKLQRGGVNLKRCLLLIDEHWESATLSDKDIQTVKDDIQGLIQNEHLITLDNGESIDTGIVDDIKILE